MNPHYRRGRAGRAHAVVAVTVHIESNDVRFPLHGVEMVVVRHRRDAGERVLAGDPIFVGSDPGSCGVPAMTVASEPQYSMTSISPHRGQSTVGKSLPIVQNAGHMPLPVGILMRASKRP